MVTSSAQQQYQQHHKDNTGGVGGSLQVLEDEVARVHLSHDITLNKLNLDFEQFLKPESPEPVLPKKLYFNSINTIMKSVIIKNLDNTDKTKGV